MTKDTKDAWNRFETLLIADLNKKSYSYFKKYHDSKVIAKAYKLINVVRIGERVKYV